MQGIDVGQIGKLSNENLTKYGRDRHGCVPTGLFHTLPPAKAYFGYMKKGAPYLVTGHDLIGRSRFWGLHGMAFMGKCCTVIHVYQEKRWGFGCV